MEATLALYVPVLFAARFAPFTVNGLRLLTRPIPRGLVPFWAGIALDTMDQHADSVAALLHGVVFGRVAPSSRQRRTITSPTLVVGHSADPLHPFADSRMLADELASCEVEQASSPLEWRLRPERLNRRATDFALACWQTPRRKRRTGS